MGILKQEKTGGETSDNITEKQWNTVLELSQASPDQLALYRTQAVIKLDETLKLQIKTLKTIKKLLIAAVVCLVIIALFV
jgi:hypothetical protein